MPKKKTEPNLIGPGGVPIMEMPPDWDFLNATMILQGAPKIGKTSTIHALKGVAEEIGIDGVNPFFIHTEAGSKGVGVTGTCEVCPNCGGKKKGCSACGQTGIVRKVLTTDEELEEWLTWTTENPVNPVVIDTGDGFYQHIYDAVCARYNVTNAANVEKGLAWTDIFNKLRYLLSIPTDASKAVIVIMHITYREQRVRGVLSSVATFGVSGKSKPFLDGWADIILHMTAEADEDGNDHRMLYARPVAGIEAGDRFGIFPDDPVDMGSSAEEGAKALLSQFYEVE